MSSSHVDRNLLFGFLALQNNFIAREELIAAVSVWLTDKSRSLAEILRQRRALTDDDEQLIAALARKVLDRHGDNAQQSIASLSGVGALREDLKNLGDADIAASLVPVSQPRHAAEPDPLVTLPVDRSASEATRFRILRPHAEGGLGRVFVAQDIELNREVALKEIKLRHADDPDSRSRFVLEAEITGGLEHPGIVPVYGLGQYDDGRPFYAMRFIRGDSLEAAIKRFHDQDDRAAGFDSVEFRKLLGRFVDVCNAIEYAHSRGVLHRDLKPGNIMLGKYGETLVVDWGLAKAQGRDERHQLADEHTLQPRSGSGSAATQMGSVVGTPAFMSPEQAAGRLDQLGPASDVYSLGATLYYLLTCQPPFPRDDLAALLRKVQAGEFSPPQLIKPHVPPPLAAICLKAMATRSADRYPSPQALAEDIDRFLADEPVEAYPEPLLARGRRWIRRHPALAATTAATLVLGSVSLAALLLLAASANQRLDAANQKLGDANQRLQDTNSRLASSNEALDRANAELNDANQRLQAAVQLAHDQNKLALETLNFLVFQVDTELGKVPGAGEVRRTLLNGVLERVQQVSDKYQSRSAIDRHSAAALVSLGDLLMRIGSAPSAGADANNAGGATSAVQAARKLYEQAHGITTRLAEANPRDQEAQRDLSVSYQRLGDIAFQAGELTAAREFYEKELETSRSLAEAEPQSTWAQRDLSIGYERLGDISLRAGDLTAARDFFEKELEITRRLMEADPSDQLTERTVAISYNKLGDVAVKAGDFAAAREFFAKDLEISRRVAEANPHDRSAQRGLSITYDRLGDMARQAGDLAAARASFEQSLEIRRKLAEADPRDREAQRDLTISHDRLGDVAFFSQDFTAARSSFDQGLKIRLRLAEADPRDAQAQDDLATSRFKLGVLAMAAKDWPAAIESFEAGRQILIDFQKRTSLDVFKTDLARFESAIQNCRDAQSK